MALNVEEHTITQSVLALEQPAAWKALESFTEYGSWHQDRVTWGLTRLIATAPGRIWHGYHVSAVDDTKVHRSSPHVWGTCTFHEYTARCPNRAATVHAHNWVVSGGLLPEPEKPAWFLPISGRLYFRKSQLPVGPRVSWNSTPSANWPSRCSASRPSSSRASIWPFSTAVTPWRAWSSRWSCPQASTRIEFLTRLRCNARLYALPLPPEQYPEGKPGPKPKWGKRLEPPRRGGMWNAKWQVGTASSTAGSGDPLEGDHLPVASPGLGGASQGDCCLRRGLQAAVHPGDLGGGVDGAADGGVVHGAVPAGGRVPRPGGGLGWEECRAWTANPIQRTSQGSG